MASNNIETKEKGSQTNVVSGVAAGSVGATSETQTRLRYNKKETVCVLGPTAA